MSRMQVKMVSILNDVFIILCLIVVISLCLDTIKLQNDTHRVLMENQTCVKLYVDPPRNHEDRTLNQMERNLENHTKRQF